MKNVEMKGKNCCDENYQAANPDIPEIMMW
jgi:hypothetical protein